MENSAYETWEVQAARSFASRTATRNSCTLVCYLHTHAVKTNYSHLHTCIHTHKHTGMIVLLGKHQFTVSSIDDAGSASTDLSVNLTAPPKSGERWCFFCKSYLKKLFESKTELFNRLYMTVTTTRCVHGERPQVEISLWNKTRRI